MIVSIPTNENIFRHQYLTNLSHIVSIETKHDSASPARSQGSYIVFSVSELVNRIALHAMNITSASDDQYYSLVQLRVLARLFASKPMSIVEFNARKFRLV